MIKNAIRVVHTGDIQIEVRNRHQRFDEYQYCLSNIISVLKSKQPELYIIAGDVFEHCRPNDIERLLFIEHLNEACKIESIKEIVITYGNHDVDQKKSQNFYKLHGESEDAANSLDSIVAAVQNDKIMLLSASLYYKSKNIHGLSYKNWSQKTKHSSVVNENYNPDLNDNIDVSRDTCITLYHDPIAGCKMWDDSEFRHSQTNTNAINVFSTNSIIAGDIHIPQVLQSDNKQFIYCGSPVPRNFGEGDYYSDGRITQKNSERHPVNFFVLTATGDITDQEYIKIPQYRCYSTFEISSKIDSNFAALNFKIENTGRFESRVRVKLPSATPAYLKAENEIIETIKEQNPGVNIDINFGYGKMLDVSDNGETIKSEDIEHLLSPDKLMSIATDYIKKQVQRSNSISTEDKDKCISKILEIFTSEMNNFSSSIVSNNIQLLHLDISNFMSFGSGVSINLDVNGLTKLVGGNGVGKTTMYNCIKWILTGFISQEQNRTKKNENNLLIFNDYLWNENQVTGSLKCLLNSKAATIERVAIREWKKNVTDEQKQSEDWKSYVANTSQSVSISYTDDTVTGDAAETILESVFGGLSNLDKIVFPNQFTLKNLVCSDSARLCEEILNHVGLNFFDKMYDRYDEIRKLQTKDISKPAESIESVNIHITSAQDEIEKLNDTLDVILATDTALTANLYAVDESIKTFELKKHKDIDDAAIEASTTLIKISEEDIASRTTKINKAKEILETELASTSIEKLTASITSEQNKLKTVNDNYATAVINLEKLKSEIKDKAAEGKERQTTIINEFNEAISKLNLQISNTENKRIDIVNKITLAEQKITDCINLENEKTNASISKLKLELSAITSTKEKYDLQLININTSIDELRKSDTCPTCKRKLDAEHLVHITSKLHEHELSKTTLTESIEQSKSQEIAKQLEIDNLTELLDKTKNPKIVSVTEIQNLIISSLNNELKEITNDISVFNKQVVEINAESKTKVKTDDKICSILKEYQILKDKLTEDEPKIELLQTEITNQTTVISTVNEQLQTYNKKLQQREQTKLIEQQILTDELKLTLQKEQLDNDIKHLLENKELQTLIDSETEKQTVLKENIKSNTQLETATRVSIETQKHALLQYKQTIEDIINYRIVESSLKQYKTLLGKQGLPQHIFSMIRGVLNSKLNDLLEDMEFRLHFNKDNQLQMIDLSKPGNPVRTPMQISGMQTCFTGLALIYVNRMCNNTFIMDSLFIDEVSGQLNSGEDLTYETKNYQDQLKQLLKKFNKLKVWIIDHVIDDMEEDNRYEVVPSTSGASII